MKTALITGGLGFIGAHIAIDLLKNKKVKRCILLDNFGGYINPTKKNFYDFRKKRLDLIKNKIVERCDTSNFKSVFEIIKKHKPEIIFHTAALPLAKLDNLNTDEAKIGSVDSTVNILDAITLLNKVEKKYKCKRFIYLSSSMVYGDFETKIVSENSNKDPKEIYGSIKLAGEIISSGYMKRYGIDVRIVRPTAVYGPYDGNQRVLYKFITRALKGEKLFVDGDGSMELDFTYVEDTAQGIYKVSTCENISGEVFNIARGNSESLSSAIKIISQNIDGVNIEYREVPSYMPNRGTLDISKAKKMVGFKPKFDLAKALPVYIEHLKNNPI